MLEFIVLGHVPGTNVYLSFESVALIVVGIVLSATALKILLISIRRLQYNNMQAKQTFRFVFARTILD